MGIMINGKKVAGLMIGGKKIAGAAYGGKVVYRDKPPVTVVWQRTLYTIGNCLLAVSGTDLFITSNREVQELDCTTGNDKNSFYIDGSDNLTAIAALNGDNYYMGNESGSVYAYSGSSLRWKTELGSKVNALSATAHEIYVGDQSGTLTKLNYYSAKEWSWKESAAAAIVSVDANSSLDTVYVGDSSGNITK